MLKPQDILVLTRLLIARKRQESVSYLLLSQWTGLSSSETHAAVKRASQTGLLTRIAETELSAFAWQPSTAACEEFFLHGLKYVFPLIFESVQRGVPTGTAVPGLNAGNQSVMEGDTWVWPYAEGAVRGIGIFPLYRTVPQVALADETLHQSLAALDLIRCATHRLRRLGEDWLNTNLFRL